MGKSGVLKTFLLLMLSINICEVFYIQVSQHQKFPFWSFPKKCLSLGKGKKVRCPQLKFSPIWSFLAFYHELQIILWWISLILACWWYFSSSTLLKFLLFQIFAISKAKAVHYLPLRVLAPTIVTAFDIEVSWWKMHSCQKKTKTDISQRRARAKSGVSSGSYPTE